MTATTIERVAKAIRLRDSTDEYALARAAIEAMREITPEIDDMHPPFAQKKDFHEAWRAMHDRALSPS